MGIEYSNFTLFPVKELNKFSSGEPRQGLLFRSNGQYTSYCPWAQFGDLPCDDFLAQKKTTLLTRGFELDVKKDVLEHKSFLNTGDEVLKLKCGKDLEQNIQVINEYSKTTKKLRLDFNNLSSYEEIKSLWESLNNQKQIEYIEDPYPYDDSWVALQHLGIKIACDRNPPKTQINIYKPAVDPKSEENKINIFSSYMGHDLERYHCYLALMDYGKLDLCHGIDTPNLFRDQRELFIKKDNKFEVNLAEVEKMYQSFDLMDWKQWI